MPYKEIDVCARITLSGAKPAALAFCLQSSLQPTDLLFRSHSRACDRPAKEEMADEVDRPYAGQEGEINDKLLLDLAWERQQKKVRAQYVRAGSW